MIIINIIDEYCYFSYPTLFCTMLFPEAFKCYCYTNSSILSILAFGEAETIGDNSKEIQSEMERIIQKTTRNITKTIGIMLSENEKKCSNIERNITEEIYPVIIVSNTNSRKEVIDYGCYMENDNFKIYLTNDYFVTIEIAHNDIEPYLQRMVYNIETEKVINKSSIEISIKNINNEYSGILYSDDDRWKGELKLCDIQRRFYSCIELKTNCETGYNSSCLKKNPINNKLLPSTFTITLFNTKIIIGDYILTRIKSEKVVKMMNNVTINSYSLPIRSSFLLDNNKYFASDFYIGNISVKDNTEMNVSIINKLDLIHYSINMFYLKIIYQ